MQVHAKVRSLISEGDGDYGAADAVDADTPPSPKVMRLDDKYKRYRQQQTAASAAAQDEVTRYLAMTASVPSELLLQHWKMMVSIK